MERSLFERLPGYALFRSLTQRLAEEDQESAWKPAVVEIEEALVPAFIIEGFEDGRFTVFVPSVPTPLAGAVCILNAANRVRDPRPAGGHRPVLSARRAGVTDIRVDAVIVPGGPFPRGMERGAAHQRKKLGSQGQG